MEDLRLKILRILIEIREQWNSSWLWKRRDWKLNSFQLNLINIQSKRIIFRLVKLIKWKLTLWLIDEEFVEKWIAT